MARQQGPITIQVVCDETPDRLTPDWVIPAGTAAGPQSKTYENIPAGAVCTVTEMVNGTNSSVQVTVHGSGASNHSPDGILGDCRPDRRLQPPAGLPPRPEVDHG